MLTKPGALGPTSHSTPTSRTFQSQRPGAEARALLLIVVSASLLTLLQYTFVALVDSGTLFVSDDEEFLSRVHDGLSLGDLLRVESEHLMPTTVLLYYLLYSLAGTWWPVYGWTLLASHATLCALVGLIIWRFSGSVFPALVITWPLTLSFSLSSGVLLQFANIPHYLAYISYLSIILLLKRYADTGSPTAYLLILGTATACMFVTTAAVLVVPLILIYHALFKFLRSGAGTRLRSLLTVDRKDLLVLVGVAVAMALYALALVVGVLVYGNPLPGQIEYGAPTPEPQIMRMAQAVSYGFVGLFPFGDFDWMPSFLNHLASRNVILMFVGILLIVGFFFMTLVHHVKNTKSTIIIPSSFALASILILFIYVLMAVTGRKYLQFYHIRYNGPAVVFASIVLGLLLAVVIARLPVRERMVANVASLVAGAWLALLNVEAVEASRWFGERQQPDFNWEHSARVGWTVDGSMVVVRLEDRGSARVYHDGTQVLDSGVPSILTFNSKRNDTVGLHDVELNPSRLTARAAGTYFVAGNLAVDPSVVGGRRAEILVNGNVTAAREETPGAIGGPTFLSVAAVCELMAGDYAEIRVTQSSEQRLRVQHYPNHSPEFMMARLPESAAAPLDLLEEFSPNVLGLVPSARVRVGADQPLAEDRRTKLGFVAEPATPDFAVTETDWGRLLGKPSRLVSHMPGQYLVIGRVTIGSRHPGFRRLTISVNGLPIAWHTMATAEVGEPRTTVAATVWQMNDGDYLELSAMVNQWQKTDFWRDLWGTKVVDHGMPLAAIDLPRR